MTIQKTKDNIDWEIISRSFRETLSPEEDKKLREWLEASPRHREFYQRALEDDPMDVIEGLSVESLAKDLEQINRRIEVNQQISKRQRWIRYIGWAATILLPVFACIWFIGKQMENNTPKLPETSMVKNEIQLRLSDGQVVNLSSQEQFDLQQNGTNIQKEKGSIAYRADSAMTVETIQYNELSVPVTGEYHITLADGSKLWVNSNTRVKYPVPFPKDKREIEVDGEVYLEVKKDGRPFSVRTKAGTVRVLGTSFGVRTYGEEVLTTLVAGSVRFTNNAGHQVELTPGEQAIATMDIVNKRNVQVEEYVGWKDGWYIFHEQRLEEVMNTLAYWYGTHVFWRNERIKDIRFTGNLRRYNSVDTFLQVLTASEDVHYEINEKTIILY